MSTALATPALGANTHRASPTPLQAVSADADGLALDALAGADLRGRDLTRAKLAGADLTGADLRGAILFEADLSGADLTGADLRGADLTRCNASSAGLGNAKLAEANFFGADLRNATLSGATLDGADLRTADLRGARLLDADLRRADFDSADLRDATLRRSKVGGARFDHADFGGACLRELDGGVDASWIEARVAAVDFCGAYLLRRAIHDQNYLYEFRTRSRRSRVVYWLWWLTSDCGRSLARWGGCIATVVFAFGLMFSAADVSYGDYETWLSPYYYSLVTLTSLGYGDVLPMSVTSQALAMVEVALGYMMLGGMLSIFANMMARRAD